MTDGCLETVDGGDDDRCESFLVNWHLNRHMRASEAGGARSCDIGSDG